MTIGDLIAGYLADRDERVAREAEAARRAAGRRPRAVPEPPGVASTEMEARPGLIDRMRDRLAGAHDAEEEPPLIVRRERPATNGNGRPRPAAPTPPAPDSDLAADGEDGPPGARPPSRSWSTRRWRTSPRRQPVRWPMRHWRRWSAPGSCRPIDLLADAPESSAAQIDLTAKGQRIRETLAHFGIGVKVSRIQEGPVVTQYALDVDPGIKLSRIEGLVRQPRAGAGRRAASASRRRFPASRTSGIEIPNAAFDLVTLKEVLASRNFAETSEAVEARLRAGPGRGRPAVQRRPVEDAAPAHRRRHRLGQERLRQRDHRQHPDERHAGRGEAHPDRPQARRAGAVQGHPAPAVRGHRRAGQGRQRPEVDGRHDGEPLRRVRAARRAQHRRLQRGAAARPAADAVHRRHHRRAGRPDDGLAPTRSRPRSPASRSSPARPASTWSSPPSAHRSRSSPASSRPTSRPASPSR